MKTVFTILTIMLMGGSLMSQKNTKPIPPRWTGDYVETENGAIFHVTTSKISCDRMSMYIRHLELKSGYKSGNTVLSMLAILDASNPHQPIPINTFDIFFSTSKKGEKVLKIKYRGDNAALFTAICAGTDTKE